MTYNNKKIKKIIYIESNIDGTIGGSYFSLLLLIKKLNKNKFLPVVVFYKKNILLNEFKNAGSKVILFVKPNPINFTSVTKNFSKKIPLFESPINYLFSIIQKLVNFFIIFMVPSFRCCAILHKQKIDLIHLNNTLKKPPEWILASLLSKAKIIAHERGINQSFTSSEMFLSHFLNAIICISDAVKKNLLKNNFPENNLFLIYNGLDPISFKPTKEKRIVFEEFNFKESNSVIGVVGNIKQWKGQETIIRAMIHVRRIIPEAKCLLVGDTPQNGNYLSHLKSIIRSNQLEDCIIFTGHRTDIPDLINIFSILVHTSVLPEPFGRVLLEGMALNKPVITTNIGAGPEIVLNGETGIIVLPGHENELAEAIIELLNNPVRADQMGKAGRKRLEEYFHIDNTAIEIEKLYEIILR